MAVANTLSGLSLHWIERIYYTHAAGGDVWCGLRRISILLLHGEVAKIEFLVPARTDLALAVKLLMMLFSTL